MTIKKSPALGRARIGSAAQLKRNPVVRVSSARLDCSAPMVSGVFDHYFTAIEGNPDLIKRGAFRESFGAPIGIYYKL